MCIYTPALSELLYSKYLKHKLQLNSCVVTATRPGSNFMHNISSGTMNTKIQMGIRISHCPPGHGMQEINRGSLRRCLTLILRRNRCNLPDIKPVIFLQKKGTYSMICSCFNLFQCKSFKLSCLKLSHGISLKQLYKHMKIKTTSLGKKKKKRNKCTDVRITDEHKMQL